MMPKHRAILLLLLLLLLCLLNTSYSEELDEEEDNIKHPKKNVVERKLVGEKISIKSVLRENKNYALDTDKKNFKGATLGYVTPWYALFSKCKKSEKNTRF